MPKITRHLIRHTIAALNAAVDEFLAAAFAPSSITIPIPVRDGRRP